MTVVSQHFSCGVYDSQLTAGTESRVPAENHLTCDRRLHEKLRQVFTEDRDGAVLSLLCQHIPDLTLNSRGDQTTVAVSDDLF